jgi:NAD-dependent dihydropyrimidine dehydrogenase PreA subunit
MTYVIGAQCIDILDKSCIEVCPVDCIYLGDRKMYIQPDECIDCGACEAVCPIEAIKYKDSVTAENQPFIVDNEEFFSKPLPGRDEPLGWLGSSLDSGQIGVDTPLVAGWVKAK